MKYMVTARWWQGRSYDTGLPAAFGDKGSVHDLTPEEVVAAIEKFGRASIESATTDPWATEGAEKILGFENDYD